MGKSKLQPNMAEQIVTNLEACNYRTPTIQILPKTGIFLHNGGNVRENIGITSTLLHPVLFYSWKYNNTYGRNWSTGIIICMRNQLPFQRFEQKSSMIKSLMNGILDSQYLQTNISLEPLLKKHYKKAINKLIFLAAIWVVFDTVDMYLSSQEIQPMSIEHLYRFVEHPGGHNVICVVLSHWLHHKMGSYHEVWPSTSPCFFQYLSILRTI